MTYAIRAEGLTKAYKFYRRPADRLVESITRSPRHVEIRALDDVSFEVAPGEFVGLVGRNGAGKSTLLKILAGVVTPSAGTLATSGRVASILELGTGFHPEFSGRANAELNAAILGLGPDEVRARLPEILEFSELGSFLEQPVRTYSSGMVMRLGFSVAVHVDPDILLVDEALAVGDGHFQKKCIERMRQFQKRRSTIVFCSHSLAAVAALCRRAIWLDRGRVAMLGPASDVIRAYESELVKQDAAAPGEGDALPERPSPVRLREAAVIDAEGAPRTTFEHGEPVVFSMRIESENRDEPIHIVAGLDRTIDQVQCASFGTHWDGLEPLSGQNVYDVELVLRGIPLTSGDFRMYLFVGDGSSLHVYDRSELRFSIAGASDPGTLFAIDHEWQL